MQKLLYFIWNTFNSTLTKTLACLSRRCLCKQWDVWRYFSPENKCASVSISCYFFHIVSEATDSWSHIMCLSFHVWGTLRFKSLEMNTYDGENTSYGCLFILSLFSLVFVHMMSAGFTLFVFCALPFRPPVWSQTCCAKSKGQLRGSKVKGSENKGMCWQTLLIQAPSVDLWLLQLVLGKENDANIFASFSINFQFLFETT